MKLNKKGFAISSIMYLILILALILISLTITLIISRKIIIDKQKKDVLNSIESNLSLSKITYIELPFDNSWAYNNATVDENGVLTVGPDGNPGIAISDYINVNGGFYYMVFDGFVTNASESYSPWGGILITTAYYDTNFSYSNNIYEYFQSIRNGWGYKIPLNVWSENLNWFKGKNKYDRQDAFGEDIKYIRMGIISSYFDWSEKWSVPPIQVRNLKLYGEKIPNYFYLINVKLKNSKIIQTIKYAYGRKNKLYFINNGNISSENPILVTKNGIYTVYVLDEENNEYVSTIKITNIIE